MRKICIMLTIVTILVSGASFAEVKTTFNDLKDTYWAKSSIDYLHGIEIITGYPDGSFKPENNVKINEFILMTVKSLGYHFESKSTDWAKPYIDKAIELGVIEDQEFLQYTADITREQMASIVVNALALTENRPSSALDAYVKNDMKDYHLVDDYYKQNVMDCYKYGIITGYPDGTFAPQGLAKRSEASRVLVTTLKEEERKPYENGEVKSTMMPVNYTDENGEHAVRFEKMYAPIFNGEPVNELVEIGEHLVNVQDLGKGYLNIGADPYTQQFSVGGYQSKDFYDSIFDALTPMQQSFLYSERKDFQLDVEPLNLTSKHKPYTLTIWKNQSHVNRSINYDKYFMERYEDQCKPIFEILFEEKSNKALGYFEAALNHSGERNEIETTINNRHFYVSYSGTGMTLTVSLKK